MTKKLRKLDGFEQIVEEEGIPVVEASGKDKRWIQDPAGYLLFKLDRENKVIRVGICTPDHRLVKEIRGKDPEELYYAILKEGVISNLDHAAYLGLEVEKAFVALHTGKEFVQCKQLEF
ncbi:hypothetical protein CMO92_01400 [Candidatus Woesearchaeota archaeon]|nr:hypothetical protein [Candidatus Woesearchaeota archaeon]|tara:strand:- start:964 stop:1320 length:357 start_codon:yes stop_codon:yes gene_type:complete